jgi:hypothetical protein
VILFLAFLIGKVDTLELPEPVMALAVSPDSIISCLAQTGDELIVLDSNVTWKSVPLPERTLTVRRMLFFDDLLYILEGGDLVLYDLRSSSKGIIAEDIDDACMTSAGELWVLSDLRLRRLSPLGNLLEERTISIIPLSIWWIHDSLFLLVKGGSLPLDSAQSRELGGSGLEPSTLIALGAKVVIAGNRLFFLADPTHIIIAR